MILLDSRSYLTARPDFGVGMFLAHSRGSYKYPAPIEKQPLFTFHLRSGELRDSHHRTISRAPLLGASSVHFVFSLCFTKLLCSSQLSLRLFTLIFASSLATPRESFSIPCLLLPLLDAASVQFFVLHAIYLLFPTLYSLPYPSPPQSALPLRLRLSLCLHNPIVSLRFIYRPTHSFALFLTVSPFLLTTLR
jgi:hypothetical protein